MSGDDGSAEIWHRDLDLDLDGDGRLDAFGLDFDGDGLHDDAFVDLDGDGVADHVVLDLDNDGTPEAYFTDDGSGTWGVATDQGRQLRWFGLDGAEHTGGPLVDFDSHGGATIGCSIATGTGWPIGCCAPATRVSPDTSTLTATASGMSG